jgi:hypothetical protein
MTLHQHCSAPSVRLKKIAIGIWAADPRLPVSSTAG